MDWPMVGGEFFLALFVGGIMARQRTILHKLDLIQGQAEEPTPLERGPTSFERVMREE